MTRFLIVDDDPRQVRLLARVFRVRDPELSVLTAHSGSEAVELLRTTPVDLVLTDLQMPDMGGMELVRWMLQHQPHVQVFTMTAYPDEEAVKRLHALGSVECYTKPLDAGRVLERIADALTTGLRGHVRNISLPSLLQVIELEQKTCTLTVESAGRTGHLYVRDGVLVDARQEETRGELAAVHITSWCSAAITITNTCIAGERTIHRPLSFIIMEALRVSDEHLHAAEVVSTAPAEAIDDGAALDEWNTGEHGTVAAFPSVIPREAEASAVAIVDADSGRIQTAAGELESLEPLAALVASIYATEARTVARLGIDEPIDELVVTTRDLWTMARPLRGAPRSLAMLVFDPRHGNVVLERMQLDAFVSAFERWRTGGGNTGGVVTPGTHKDAPA